MDPKRLPIVDEVKKILNPEPAREAPLPELWGVLYAEPMPGGARRRCDNCIMWVSTENKCVIHPKELKVTGLMICGYHVPGAPLKKWIEHAGIAPVNPKYSGLGGGEVPNGTSCDNCKFFESVDEESGVCHGTQKKKHPAPVHPKGCCARWEEKTEE